jgi:hypothetical protein
MSHKGFSHVGLSTLDLDRTRDFYENVLGFKAVRCDVIRIIPVRLRFPSVCLHVTWLQCRGDVARRCETSTKEEWLILPRGPLTERHGVSGVPRAPRGQSGQPGQAMMTRAFAPQLHPRPPVAQTPTEVRNLT